MQNIPLAMAREGMVLAREVMRPDRPDGPVLFGRGATLTETAIERLRQLGIEVVTVEGRPLKLETDESLEEQLNKLELRFRPAAHDPMMLRLRDLIRRQIIHSMKP